MGMSCFFLYAWWLKEFLTPEGSLGANSDRLFSSCLYMILSDFLDQRMILNKCVTSQFGSMRGESGPVVVHNFDSYMNDPWGSANLRTRIPDASPLLFLDVWPDSLHFLQQQNPCYVCFQRQSSTWKETLAPSWTNSAEEKNSWLVVREKYVERLDPLDVNSVCHISLMCLPGEVCKLWWYLEAPLFSQLG